MLLKFNCIGVTVCTVIIIAFQLRVYQNQKMKARYLYRSPHSKTHFIFYPDVCKVSSGMVSSLSGDERSA